MPRDPVGFVVFIALFTTLAVLALALVCEIWLPVKSPWLRRIEAAVTLAMQLFGLVLLGAAFTIDAPIVPFVIGALGLIFVIGGTSIGRRNAARGR